MRWKKTVSMQDREWEDECAWTSGRIWMGVMMGMLSCVKK